MADNKQDKDVDSYIIIKGRFKAIDSNTFGLFLIYISLAQKIIDNVILAASHYSSIYDTNPNTQWDVFEDKITAFKWKGEISQNISHDLQLLLSNTIKLDVLEEILDAHNTNQHSKIEHTLTGIMAKGVADKSIIIEALSEKVPHMEILRVKDDRLRKEKEEREEKQKEEIRKDQQQEYKVEAGAVVLPVSLVLAPVSGIPIWEVKTGDLIVIRIDSATERGNYFIDLLKARTPEGDILPIKAVIKEITSNSLGEFEVLVELGPGIYGRCVETEKVKIKKFDISEEKIAIPGNGQEKIKTPVSEAILKQSFVPKATRNDYFIWLVGGITLLLAALILYLLFSGIL